MCVVWCSRQIPDQAGPCGVPRLHPLVARLPPFLRMCSTAHEYVATRMEPFTLGQLVHNQDALVPIGNLTVIKLVDEVERGTICKSLGPEYTLMGSHKRTVTICSIVGTLYTDIKNGLHAHLADCIEDYGLMSDFWLFSLFWVMNLQSFNRGTIN